MAQKVQNLPTMAGDLGLIPGLGRSPRGNSYPFQYSGLENPMGCIVHGVAKSQTRMSNLHSLFTTSLPFRHTNYSEHSQNLMHTFKNSVPVFRSFSFPKRCFYALFSPPVIPSVYKKELICYILQPIFLDQNLFLPLLFFHKTLLRIT